MDLYAKRHSAIPLAEREGYFSTAMSLAISTSDATPPTRIERRCLIVLLLLATALRAGLVWWKWDWLALDRDLYLELGRNVADGEGFTLLRSAIFTPTAYRPPLYPLFLSMIFRFGGGLWTVAVIQVGLSAATVWLTWRIGRALGLGKFALVGAAFVAVNPLLVQTAALPMTETLCTFLLAGLFSVCLCGTTTTRPVSLGIWLGLAALCRPTVWAFAMLGSFITVVANRRMSAQGWREMLWARGRSWGITLIAFGLTVSPWVIRNWCVFDRLIVTTTHGGYTLLLGNNDDAYHQEVLAAQESGPYSGLWNSVPWQNELDRELARANITLNNEVDRDRWMKRKAWDWIRHHPIEFLESCLLRQKRFWSVRPGGADVIPLPVVVRWGITTFYLLELGAAAIGLWSLRREEWRAWWPLVLLVVSFALVHVVYWSNLRMRAPVEPVLALLAARGFVGRWDKGRVAPLD